MSLTDSSFDELMEIRSRMKTDLDKLQQIALLCLHPAHTLSALEKERLRQQARANTEAVERCNAEEALAAANERIQWLEDELDGMRNLYDGERKVATDRAVVAAQYREALVAVDAAYEQDRDVTSVIGQVRQTLFIHGGPSEGEPS